MRDAAGDATSRTLLVTRSRLRYFAKATGQTDPVYVDVDAARRAGHRDLPVPPTFYFSVEFETADPFAWMAEQGIELSSVLHGGQRFEYHRMAYAGDELTATSRLSDSYEKRGGELRFFVRSTEVVDAAGDLVAELTSTNICRRAAG